MSVRFTASRTSMFRAFSLGIAMVAVFETPVLHVLFHASPWWVHVLIAGGNAAMVAWILWRRHKLQESAVTVGDESVEVFVPGRWRGAIPLTLVTSAARVSLAPGAPRPKGVLQVTPFDSPNVELGLREQATLVGSFGRRRSAARVQLFVDEPDALVARLQGGSQK
jgi:hypothetical protein